MFEFYVDIENTSGTKLGSGPLASVQSWRYTARMDRAGEIDFVYSASDPQASIVANRNIARAKALINGVWTEVGAGIIDQIDTVPGADGAVSLSASGMDLIRELSFRSVGSLEIGSGSGATHATALAAIGALAPLGWTFTPAGAPDNDYIYARYGGESVLGALVYMGEKTQTHFYRSSSRTLVFTSAFSDSGVRAIRSRGDLVAETCAITSLRRTVDTHDLLTRITPYGSGQGAARLTLAATSRAAPSGYTLSAANNYIESTAATTAYGLVSFPEIEFKEITPISNTDADLQAAANMLFDAALEELKRRSTLATQQTYALTIAGCSQLLRPMQTIRVIYRDPDQGISIDANLKILEATWQVDATGIRTTNLVVSTDDRWPVSDVVAGAERAVEGRVFQAHPQLNANSYVTGYTKNVDANEMAAFRFRFGAEVTQLQQVLFEFQILPFESTVLSVGGESGGSAAATDGPSTNDTGSGGNNDTGQTTPMINLTTPTINLTTPTINLTTPTINLTTPTINLTTPTINLTTPTINLTTPTIGQTTPTINTTALTTNTATGGDSDSSGFHQHATNVIAGTGSLGNVSLHETGGLFFLANPFVTGSEPVYVTPGGAHTHTINSHDHTINPHDHSMAGHTHPMSGHTHPLPGHTHDLAGHVHTMGGHVHTMGGHVHTMGGHVHTMGGHTHTMGGHTHSLNNHTHDLSQSISAIYGIFREESANTYVIDDLQYRVNGGSWLECNTATDISDGWERLDITSLVASATTFRPVAANNLMEVRATTIGTISISLWSVSGGTLAVLTSGAHGLTTGDKINIHDAPLGSVNSVDINGDYVISDTPSTTAITISDTGLGNEAATAGGTIRLHKTATIDAQLSVRNIIQAVAYS